MVERECIIGDGCKFEFDAFFDGQPVKLTKKVCLRTMWATEFGLAAAESGSI